MTLTERVKELHFHRGEYAVFGSGPMEAHGLRHAHDIDIIVTSDLFQKCKENPEWIARELRDHHQSLKKGDIELYDSWAPDSWDIPAMINDAEIIEGVAFVRLETVLDWKKIRNQ